MEKQILTPIQLKLVNTLKKNKKGLRRSKIVEITGYPRTTIFDNLEKLMKFGYIEKGNFENNGLRGRPPTIWRVL